jgi:hypothetical protein
MAGLFFAVSGHRRASGDQGQSAARHAEFNRPGRGCADLKHSAARGNPRKRPIARKHSFHEGNDMNVARLLLTLALLFVVCKTRSAFAQQTPTVTTPSATDITPTAEEPSSSPWGWIKKPKISMPKISFPKMPADPFAPVKSSARKVSEGTKRAWEGTKEIFSFGGSKEQPAARTAAATEAPSMWQRMFGGKKEEPEGPKTVAEWMAQKRVE